MIKQHFNILVTPPEYSMDVQAWVFPTLAVIHNCILKRDPIKIADISPPYDDGIDVEYHGQLVTEYPGQVEKDRANARCDQITENTWNDYQTVL